MKVITLTDASLGLDDEQDPGHVGVVECAGDLCVVGELVAHGVTARGVRHHQAAVPGLEHGHLRGEAGAGVRAPPLHTRQLLPHRGLAGADVPHEDNILPHAQ